MSLLTFDINLNHIFFLLILVFRSIREIFLKQLSEENNQIQKRFFKIYICTISDFFAIFFICIAKIRSRGTNKDKVDTKLIKNDTDIKLIYSRDILPIKVGKLLIRTLLVSISNLLAQFSVFLFYVFDDDDNDFQIKEVYSIVIFRIISTYLFSKIILKKHFYRHHYLSFIINIIGIIVFLIIDINNINEFDLKIIVFISILGFSGICYSFQNVIGKLALNNEFLSPYSIMFFRGVYGIILLIISSIPFMFIKFNGNNLFYAFVNNLNNFKNICYILIVMLTNFGYNVSIWIIIDKFYPDYIAMAMIIENIYNIIYQIITDYDNLEFSILIWEIIINIILIIGTSIHNEVIVINCCKFNEYTIKKIGAKGEEDYLISSITNNFDESGNNEVCNDSEEKNESKDNI